MADRIAGNKKAYHDYFIDETFEAGIVLTGTEVKSIRDYGLSLKESYAHIRGGEVWLMGVHIKPYEQGSYNNVDPLRPRKLLLHKKQIRYLDERIKEKGQTLVPTKIYFSRDNKVKVEIGLARGKKNYDKRATIAKKDAQRDIERTLKSRNQ
ncbi:MAG: SsrA-binding protein SmpB [Coriobacteriia bacterium]|nr:SsrA-binding protein SmpB [Coriobacteriia bacterium]MCL2537114.1 SsrA-binding protein SmpB [Coriobacteriia bacterium]